MRFTFSFILFLSFSFSCLAQKNKQPKNIESALRILDESLDENILNESKKLSLAEFKEVFEHDQPAYFQTVNSWIFFANKKNKLVQYYQKEGIYDPIHIRKIILNAYYRHLKGTNIDHKGLLAHYRTIEEAWASEDKDKLNQDTLRGNYIPENLEDCLTQIDATCPKEVKEDIRNWNEEDFVDRAHWGLGLWIINTWRLWEGSRLSDFFNNEGIYQPEFMADIILKSYRRHLNQEEIQAPQLYKFYKTVGQIKSKKAIEEKERAYLHYKINDTVYFKYRLNAPHQLKTNHIAACFAKGKITEKDPLYYSIKVKILDVCGDNSIMFFDNSNQNDDNSNSQSAIKRLAIGREFWFNFEDWEKK